MGHSIPNQQKNPDLLDFHEIWHRHGLFSYQYLADSTDLPLNFILKYHFSLHMLIEWS